MFGMNEQGPMERWGEKIVEAGFDFWLQAHVNAGPAVIQAEQCRDNPLATLEERVCSATKATGALTIPTLTDAAIVFTICTCPLIPLTFLCLPEIGRVADKVFGCVHPHES